MPWSTGRMETYPVPPRRPWLKSVPRLRSTVGLRSLSVKTRLEVVGAREDQVLRRECLGRVAEEGVRVVAEELVEIEARAHGAQPTGGSPGARLGGQAVVRPWNGAGGVEVVPIA